MHTQLHIIIYPKCRGIWGLVITSVYGAGCLRLSWYSATTFRARLGAVLYHSTHLSTLLIVWWWNWRPSVWRAVIKANISTVSCDRSEWAINKIWALIFINLWAHVLRQSSRCIGAAERKYMMQILVYIHIPMHRHKWMHKYRKCSGAYAWIRSMNVRLHACMREEFWICCMCTNKTHTHTPKSSFLIVQEMVFPW